MSNWCSDPIKESIETLNKNFRLVSYIQKSLGQVREDCTKGSSDKKYKNCAEKHDPRFQRNKRESVNGMDVVDNDPWEWH